MPMTKNARMLGLRIHDGPLRGLEVTSWAETRGSSGALNMISWVLPGGLEHPLTQSMLQHWVSRLPRCPWRWGFGERSKIGYMLPVWRKSRKNFAKLGFAVGKTIGRTLRKTLGFRKNPSNTSSIFLNGTH